MFVTLAKHKNALRVLAGELKRETEQKLAEKDAAILQLQGLVQEHREQPPAPVLPVVDDSHLWEQAFARERSKLLQQLALSEGARKALASQLGAAQDANDSLTRELHDLRQGVAS